MDENRNMQELIADTLGSEQVQTLVEKAKKSYKHEKCLRRASQVVGITTGIATTALAAYTIKCLHDSKHSSGGCSEYTNSSFNY